MHCAKIAELLKVVYGVGAVLCYCFIILTVDMSPPKLGDDLPKAQHIAIFFFFNVTGIVSRAAITVCHEVLDFGCSIGQSCTTAEGMPSYHMAHPFCKMSCCLLCI